MKKSFITGLVILLPLALTVGLVIFIVNFLTAPFAGVAHEIVENWKFLDRGFLFFNKAQIVTYVSQVLILMMLFLFTAGLGALARWFFVHSLINLSDYIFQRIPFFNKVYTTSQEVLKTIFTSKKRSFKQVVMVPFPNERTYSIGFVTNDSQPKCCEMADADLVSVFMPTTPNPTSGYLLMFKREEIIFLEMPTEDAIKFIISCGVIHPKSVAKKLNETKSK